MRARTRRLGKYWVRAPNEWKNEGDISMGRILVIGKYYPPYEGGTEAYTRDVCEELAKSHDVEVVAFSHTSRQVAEKINRVRVARYVPQLNWSSQPIAIQLLWRLNLQGVDLVHFHAPNFFANAILLSRLVFRRRSVPVVVTHHMDVYGRRRLKRVVLPLYRALIRRSAIVIVTSRKNAAISNDLPPGARVVAIPLGLKPDDYQLSENERANAATWRREVVGSARTIGFLGRHARYKGLDVLLRAMTRLPHVHALIGGDGPYREQWKNLANDLGLGRRAHFFGHLSFGEKKRLLAASDAFVFPSTEVTEAFGLSQLEAMAIGVPVIASDLPSGVTDVAIDGKTALLFPPGDDMQLTSRIAELLDDQALARRLVAGAQCHLMTNFTHDNVLKRTSAAIESALSIAHMELRFPEGGCERLAPCQPSYDDCTSLDPKNNINSKAGR